MTMFAEQPEISKHRGNANVKVVVRLRPPNEAEHNERYRTVTHAISEHMLVFDPKVQNVPGVLQAKPRDVNRHRFRDLKYAFDHVFGPYATNGDVFEQSTKGIVSGVLNGYNCSVFAYGATGAGKTHTMLGSECEPGVIYFTMMDLYRRIEEQKKDKVFDVAVSYSEVYNEQVRDLLVPRGNLPIREDKTVGVIIAGLSLHKPKTADELLHMLHFGNKNRTQHPTDANAESSRSHAVFQVFVNQRDKVASVGSEVVMAKMCLVDLAGSERAHHTTNCGVRFREGANINRSLLALGNVINALADNRFKGHIPYRDSKLTRLLKDSLGGNCRTVMIAAVSPSSRSFEDTYNTLRYADRAKHIRACIKKNVMNVDFHITNYKKYVQDLERQNQELKQAKQKLLESLEKTETCSSQGISPILRQFQERLKDLFKTRRDIRKVQMESEGAKRELKWKVSRREQAMKRVRQLTGSPSVLSKHSRVIERMKKRIDKEEQALQQSALRIQDQDSAICRAITEFTAADGRQAPELLDLNARTYIVESNLYDSDMHLAFVKKLARAQERQAAVTESLVTSLLQLVKKQHDVLHSQDLLSPELQSKYEQCCYLVEERGVTFCQQPLPSPSLGQREGGDDCDGQREGAFPLAVATSVEEGKEEVVDDNLKISDIINIQIPRLRVQELIQGLFQAKLQEPQRVAKPVSAVKPAARIVSTQMQEATSAGSPATLTHLAASSHSGLVSQGTFSKAPSQHPANMYPGNHPPPTATVIPPTTNPIELLNLSLEACSRQGGRDTSNNLHLSQRRGGLESPQASLSSTSGLLPDINAPNTIHNVVTLTGAESATQKCPKQMSLSSTHHQFQMCANLNPVPAVQQQTSSSSPAPPSPPLEWKYAHPGQTLQSTTQSDPPVSPDINSTSTDNLNNTFQVLKPALPNTPCIDSGPSHHQSHYHCHQTPQHSAIMCNTSNTPRGKRPQQGVSQQRLNFQTAGVVGETRQNSRTLLGQGDGRNQPHVAGFNSNNANSNFATKQVQSKTEGLSPTGIMIESGLPRQPSRVEPPIVSHLPSPLKPASKQDNMARISSPPARSLTQKPSSIDSGYKQDAHCATTTSPKSYAEALKSPAAYQVNTRTPTSSKPPARVKLIAGVKDPSHPITLTASGLNLSQLKQNLQLTSEKPAGRVKTGKPGDQPSCGASRKPLGTINANSKDAVSNPPDLKSKSCVTTCTATTGSQNYSQQATQPQRALSTSQASLQMKARPQRLIEGRHHRALALAKPYSVRNPRRHHKWQPPTASRGSVEVAERGVFGHGDTTGFCERPSYMQPTFARAQKMLGLEVDRPPQRQAAHPANQLPDKHTSLHKHRFVLA